MLNEFVEKILVHERARKGSQDTTVMGHNKCNYSLSFDGTKGILLKLQKA